MTEKYYYGGQALTGVGKRNSEGKQDRWEYRNDKNKLMLEVNYLNDKKHGTQIGYYSNGHVYVKCNFVNGVENGETIYYYESGQMNERGNYHSGEYVPVDFWDEEGNQLMKNGTGKKIEKFGASQSEVIEFQFVDGKFVKEVKISAVHYGKFIPKDNGNEG